MIRYGGVWRLGALVAGMVLLGACESPPPSGSTSPQRPAASGAAAHAGSAGAAATSPPPKGPAASSTAAHGGGAGKAAVVVEQSSGSDVELVFLVDGVKVPERFVAPPGETTMFPVPAGKLRWVGSWGETPCAGGGDGMTREIELAPGEQAKLSCWDSAKAATCCNLEGKSAPK